MDWLNLLADIFEVCIIPLLGVLTAYAVKYIQVKSAEITEKTDNALVDKYTVMLADTISACVLATNQTYVEALKKQGSFDVEAQKEAFESPFSFSRYSFALTTPSPEIFRSAAAEINFSFITPRQSYRQNRQRNERRPICRPPCRS